MKKFLVAKNWLAIGLLAFGMILVGSTPSKADFSFAGSTYTVIASMEDGLQRNLLNQVVQTQDGTIVSWVLRDTSGGATNGNLTFVWQIQYNGHDADPAGLLPGNAFGTLTNSDIASASPGGVLFISPATNYLGYTVSVGSSAATAGNGLSASLGSAPTLGSLFSRTAMNDGVDPIGEEVNSISNTPSFAFRVPGAGQYILYSASTSATNHSDILYAVTNAREYGFGTFPVLDGSAQGDTITFAPLNIVPEPATLTMLGSGLLGIVGYIKKKRQA